MSTWRLVTMELHERGPLRVTQVLSVGDACHALQVASRKGLVRRISGNRWAVTELGVAFANRRVTFRVPFVGGVQHRQKGTTLRPVATWLAPLPYPNEVRLCPLEQLAAKSEDGFPDELIGELLEQAGHEPEAAITAPVLRIFTALVAKESRKAVTR